MTAVRHSVQREVFDAGGERILAACQVNGAAGAGILCIVRGVGPEATVVLLAGEAGAWRRLRVWPLTDLRITDADTDSLNLEVVAEKPYIWRCSNMEERREWIRTFTAVGSSVRSTDRGGSMEAVGEERELAALLEEAAPPLHEAERALSDTLHVLDELNVQGMLCAEAGSQALLSRLATASTLGTALGARLERYETQARGGASPGFAREGAATHDHNARRLLQALQEIFSWLDAPELADIDQLPEVPLTTAEGRARVLRGAEALRAALSGGASCVWASRLAGVRARLRTLGRARERLAAALARHLNNTLIHLANEAAATSNAGHHQHLAPYAPFMGWLKACEEKTYNALIKVYTTNWSRVYERELKAQVEANDADLDTVLSYVEDTCNAEEDFCTMFFNLDTDLKPGEGSESRSGPEARSVLSEVFPSLEASLVSLMAEAERREAYGSMRALAAVGARAVEGAAGRWVQARLAAGAVAAKRQADRAVQARLATAADSARLTAKRAKCGLLPCLADFEEFSANCERIFSRGGRRSDVERWYCALCGAMLRAIQSADHPRTPRAVIQMENYHRLHAILSTLRLPALDGLRREAKQKYSDALRAYVTQYFGRPLEKLNQFFDGVSEAMSRGVREEEICYQAAFSKHALRKILALYPRAEVSRSLHHLYRTVEKHLSQEQNLLQVVWRAMQEEFISQHKALEARIQACYPGAGLALLFSTEDILDVFSDIAQHH